MAAIPRHCRQPTCETSHPVTAELIAWEPPLPPHQLLPALQCLQVPAAQLPAAACQLRRMLKRPQHLLARILQTGCI